MAFVAQCRMLGDRYVSYGFSLEPMQIEIIIDVLVNIYNIYAKGLSFVISTDPNSHIPVELSTEISQ